MTKNNQKMSPKIRKSIKWKPGPPKTIKKDQKTIKNLQKQSQKHKNGAALGGRGAAAGRQAHFCVFGIVFDHV